MDRFKEKFSVLPIEVMVVLAINVVVVAFGYYAITGGCSFASCPRDLLPRYATDHNNWAFPVWRIGVYMLA